MDKVDIYVLDEDLQMVGVVDAYKSLIWANRYRDLGDCELYVRATTEALDLLVMGRYLAREDDDMVCRIKKIVLDTNAEEGNYLTVTATDVKSFADQRIIWGTRTVNGSAETFIRSLITETLISPTLASRQLVNSSGAAILSLGTAAGLSDTVTEQISYKNVGEKIREYCLKYGWGYKITWESGGLVFYLYEGTDRTDSVIFSDEFENLASTSYTEDNEIAGNVALVAGVGEGPARSRATVGYAQSVDRYEIFVDADDISDEISYADLKAAFPLVASGGAGYIITSGDDYYYGLTTVDIEIVDQNQRAWLVDTYTTGTIVTVSGVEYFRITSIPIAKIPSDSPSDDDTAIYLPIIYAGYLTARGREKLSEYGAVTSFEGSVVPDVTFEYKTDYFLGDIVTVRNEFGITKEARIVEVVEVYDDNGFSIEPEFEWLESGEEEETAASGETVDFEEAMETEAEQRISELVAAAAVGQIIYLSTTNVRFSNGLEFARSRTTKSPDSSTGTQLESSGWYKYTITLDTSGTRFAGATTRPVGVCDVYLNGNSVSMPAAMRFNGSSQAWNSATVTFCYPASTLSGTVTVDAIYSFINTTDVVANTVVVTQSESTLDLTISET